MNVKFIDKNDDKAIQKCVNYCSKHYIDNLLLLGDLHEPCVKYSDIYVLMDDEDRISAVFSIFNGFMYPSLIISFNASESEISEIFNFVKKTVNSYFSLACFGLSRDLIKNNFDIVEISDELCMLLSQHDCIQSQMDIPKESANFVLEKDLEDVCDFYKLIEAYPWNPIQLESGFYRIIRKNKRLIACGGSHLETPRLVQLGNIYVLPSHRNRGYGKLLVSSIVSDVLSKKEYCSLFVRRDNSTAISLYKKLGFHIYKPISLYMCK